jgi:hypothetical protein
VNQAERGGEAGAAGVGVDQLELDAGEARAQPRHQAADHAGADHRDAVAQRGGAVPAGIDRGLEVGGQHRARGRHAGGEGDDGAGGYHVALLMRVQAEHRAAAQGGGRGADAVLHHADADVAVLERPGEVALLEGGAHAFVFAFWHLAAEHQALAAAADCAEEVAHPQLAVCGRAQRCRTQFPVARADGPEGEVGAGHAELLVRTLSRGG